MKRLPSLIMAVLWGFLSLLDAQVLVKESVQFNAGHNPVQDDLLAGLHFDEAKLPRPEEAAELKVWNFGEADFGYYVAFFDPEHGEKLLLTLYDADKEITKTINLFHYTGEPNGRLQHLSYDEGLFYFNFGPDDIDTEPYQTFHLYCLDAFRDNLVWRSEGDDSRGQFIVDGEYIISGYGGEGEPDYLYLIDRLTGISLSQCKMESRPRFMTLVKDDEGRHHYEVTDYMNTVSRFTIRQRGVEVRGEGVRLRRGPSVSAEIYCDTNGDPIYPLAGDVLELAGEEPDWFRVRYNGERLYITTGYSARIHANIEQRDVVLSWMNQQSGMAPYDILAIDVDRDGTMEYFISNLDNQQGFFTVTDGTSGFRPEAISLNCTHHKDLMHVDTGAGTVYFKMMSPSGTLSEEYYVVRHSHVAEILRREADGTFTRTQSGGSPMQISQEEYRQAIPQSGK